MGAEEDEPARSNGARDRRSPAGGRSRGETIFLIGVIVGTLAIAVGFVIATITWNLAFPSTFVAVLMGVCVATLAYTFLGGVEGAVFKLGGIQLAGSVAVIAAVVYLVKGPMAADMNDAEAIAAGRDAQARLKAANERAEKAEDERDRARRDLRRRGESGERDIIEEVRAANADTDLGKALLAMWTAREGPFARTVGDEEVTARLSGRIPDGTFEYCHSTWPRFRDRVVRFRPRDADASGEIVLTPGADIGPVCTRTRMSYSVRLGCDAARALIPNQIETCTSQRDAVDRSGATIGTLDLFAIIENPITR